MKEFLDLSHDELERLNLEAKRLRAAKPGRAEAAHRRWLKAEDGAKAVTVCFSDIEGRLHMLDYDKKWLLTHSDGLTFDGSSIRGFAELGESDLRLEIDWPAFYRLPACVFGAGKVLVFAFVRNRDGSPYPADFRGRLSGMDTGGRTVSAAMEIEGFLFDGRNAEQAYSGEFSPAASRGYCHSLPGDLLRQFIDRAAEAQRTLGFENEKDHPEVAPAQFEMNWSHTEMSIAADQSQLYKLVCRQVASQMGLTASFLPKPLAGVNGNGMHVNISISDSDGENLFHDPSSDNGLSAMAISFADGILARANDICLILNPSVNAYRRLDPNYEAPNQIRRSSIDRGSMIRVPLAGRSSARIEIRSVSPDANPYMLLYAMVGCGLKGGETPADGIMLHADIHAAMEGFSANDLVGAGEASKYAALKAAAAARSPMELGSRVKRDEVVFHHEVTNQSLWGDF